MSTPLPTLRTIADLRDTIAGWRQQGQRIALVPTMGNLHAGHLQLVRQARSQADRVVVSIFVNPLQFVDAEGRLGDFERYPRTLDADLALLTAADAVFAPAVEEVYPGGFEHQTRVEVPELSDILCGTFRPGHFSGVATVVAKLFNMAQPDVALFGEKDYQQLLVIKRLTRELCFPIDIIGVPTVREADGLALSSRNQYLDAAQRQLAAGIYQSLLWVNLQLQSGRLDYAELEDEAMQRLEAQGFRPDYVAVRRATDLQAPGSRDTDLIVLSAAWLGPARLIDNLRLELR